MYCLTRGHFSNIEFGLKNIQILNEFSKKRFTICIRIGGTVGRFVRRDAGGRGRLVVALDVLHNFPPKVPLRPGFESRPAEVGDIAICLQKTFFSILNFLFVGQNVTLQVH